MSIRRNTLPITSVALWLLCASTIIALGLYLGFLTVIPGPNSQDALLKNTGERIAHAAGIPRRDRLTMIVSHPTLDFTDAEFVNARERLVADLKELKEPKTNSPILDRVETVGRTMLGDDIFRSSDGKHLLLSAELKAPIFESAPSMAAIPDLVQRWQRAFPSFEISYVSDGTFSNEMFDLINDDLDRSLLITLPITFVILLTAFGSVVSSALCLGIALVSLGASLGMSAILSHVLGPISAAASQLVVLLVLAVGIDYSLFMISRVRDEVSRGRTYDEAIAIARRTTGVAIAWSGLTVSLSLVGLLFMRDSVLTSMAIVSIVAVLITLMSCIIALPAVLHILGPRIDAWCLRNAFLGSASQGMSRLLRLGMRNPLRSFLGASAFLLFLCYFCLDINLGTTVEPQILPAKMQTSKAMQTVRGNFPQLGGVDFSVIFRHPQLRELEDEGQLQPFLDQLHAFATVHTQNHHTMSDDGTVLRIAFSVDGSANDRANRDLVRDIRATVFPALQEKLTVEAFLSGTLPYVADQASQYGGRTLEVFAAVLSLSMLFLLFAFRSIVIPVKAIVLNLLSSGASFGCMVLLFQSPLVAGWDYGVIESFVPALLFAILFGLSMDYHVFLLSRIREHALSGSTTEEAVQRGVVETWGSITSAALIMVSVFAIIATLELPIMKQLGVGLSIAILLDATIVRIVLLPAAMLLLGKWNWYLPLLQGPPHSCKPQS